MNLNEFSALQVGDKIQNHHSQSTGEVVDTSDSGVAVKWSEGSAPFFYSAVGTTWFHWNKIDVEERRMTCPDCGSKDPPNHKPGCPRGPATEVTPT